MHLDKVPGMTPDERAKLEKAGVLNAPDLARTPDAAVLAQRAGLKMARVEALRDSARERIVTIMRDAGVRDEVALSEADVAALAQRTGLSPSDVEWFQGAAREELVRREKDAPGRVVLREDSDKARVLLGAREFEHVGIVTASRDADEAQVLGPLEGNVVLLREGAPVAVARLGGERVELPIFQAMAEGERRVRVEAILEAEKKPSSSFMGRFKKK